MSLKPPVSNKDHIQGNPHSVIELVEYGDYQCPYCGMAYPIIKAIQKKIGKDLKFVFRNFPLTQAHPQAIIAAIAAEAADKQGKFWKMHDLIFENQKNLYASSLMEYAKRLHLDMIQFEADLQNIELFNKVNEDFESGIKSGVNGTPGFFINGDKYNGNWDEETLMAAIKSKIGGLRSSKGTSQ